MADYNNRPAYEPPGPVDAAGLTAVEAEKCPADGSARKTRSPSPRALMGRGATSARRSRQDDLHNNCPCPVCGSRSSRVRRVEPTATGVRRRRICNACHGRFSTHELVLAKKLPPVTGDGSQTSSSLGE